MGEVYDLNRFLVSAKYQEAFFFFFCGNTCPKKTQEGNLPSGPLSIRMEDPGKGRSLLLQVPQGLALGWDCSTEKCSGRF